MKILQRNLNRSTFVVWEMKTSVYVPTANLTIYQKGVYYSGIKIYNHLPTAIKYLSDDKNKFKLDLKRYLLHYSFYSLEEYFNT
jgi:hypothetical protein